jgi:ribose transport system permease protein
MRKELGMALALGLMCVVLGISNPDFYNQANILNTARHIAMLGIFTIGLSFTIITGGIDLSVGSVIGLTGVIIAAISTAKDGMLAGSIWMGILLAFVIALAFGLFQGVLIALLGLQPFIVTLGGMLLLRGVSQTICHGGTISFGASRFRDLADSGFFQVGNACLLPYPIVIFLVVVLLATYLLHYTPFGRHVYAIGGNREAARYSGIPVKRVEIVSYVISAGLAALAGVVYAAYIGQMSHTVGSTYELLGIAAAVLGGCSLRGGEGTIGGIVIGSAMMKVIENGINIFKISYRDAAGAPREWRLDTNWQYIVIGAVILVAVVLDQGSHLLQSWRERRSTA